MTETKPKKSVTKPASQRPPAALGKAKTADEITRRSFFSWLSIGWVAFIAATGGFFTMMLRFFFPNVLFEPVQTFRAGYPEDYTIGEVDLRWKDKYGVWLVRNEEGIYALSTVCTHLGCTPNWLGLEQKFKCPCHGSGFYKTGINFEGPAPRPLERYKIILADDGQIIVDKTMVYQKEKNQWNNSEAFLKV
ncbi:MAG TPA: ubiquinol-cytochrome c reductase iron-sulfur subunit [Candidatus Marinimicrobia bacterium]|jgi:cytochrome b6-f complex iron-sulfur subunit|nr:ubiquinol-cytochrome c reductase iron-sulfur subunit [Candidatus Neomarinimicrobiota bacterium]HJL62748.1 ubiquinol-cytochrome c reductase iron-sulfur subunit [Candidatus Neomarinimicrobiota bacterium]HJM11581.1 ubiquinol-cytochrome c reductase iron-sulfur subunit [Candidatus Neomarinimicrobiota bacterium]|tara:strand:- start:5611 stop:6183 length:573 start_codon:yes stop_codon:yes gene_type:complete